MFKDKVEAEKAEHSQWKIIGKVHITEQKIIISKSGTIRFNTSFMRNQFPDDKPTFVQIFLNGTDLALRFTNNKKEEKLHKLWYIQGKEGSGINCKSALQEAGIDFITRNGLQQFEMRDDLELGKVYVLQVM